MFKKMKERIIATLSRERDQVIGLGLLLVFISTSFYVGYSLGNSGCGDAAKPYSMSRMGTAITSEACVKASSSQACFDAVTRREPESAQRP